MLAGQQNNRSQQNKQGAVPLPEALHPAFKQYPVAYVPQVSVVAFCVCLFLMVLPIACKQRAELQFQLCDSPTKPTKYNKPM